MANQEQPRNFYLSTWSSDTLRKAGAMSLVGCVLLEANAAVHFLDHLSSLQGTEALLLGVAALKFGASSLIEAQRQESELDAFYDSGNDEL